MRILVTGGAGYLGSVLIPKLLVRRHAVRVLDVGYFGMGHLRNQLPSVEILRDDVRRVIADKGFADELLAGVDCVIHLAAISNDPSAELQPELTSEVNYAATCALAAAARARGIRFIFSSSCSVYGNCIANQNLRVVDVAGLFEQLNPGLRVSRVELPQDEVRNYRVDCTRAQADGYCAHISIEDGAAQVCEAIVSGAIPDPESVFYRNAKWLSELTQIGGKNHRYLVGLMETIARMPGVAR